MEINRTSIDVDAAALQRMETRLIYARFVHDQYQYIIFNFQKQANKARNLMSERRRRGPSSAQTPPFEKLKSAKVARRRRASNTHKHFFLITTQLREREFGAYRVG